MARTPSPQVVAVAALLAAAGVGASSADAQPACDTDDGGLDLPDSFCATVVARDVGKARHIAVRANGDMYVALREDRRGDAAHGVVALRDTDGDGKADRVETVYDGKPGTGIGLHGGHLYFGANDEVMRWRLSEGELLPTGERETIVSGLPARASHRAKSLAFDDEGHLYVNVGSPSNACQEEDRVPGSPGQDPCPELETRAGIWRFDADRRGQTQSDGLRYATGLRNTVALTVHPESGTVYGVVHGRDQLGQNWPDLFTNSESARKPSEEFVRIREGDDFGWPYCYHDPQRDRKMLAPEYGGDGNDVGRCADKEDPILAFPAHWAPDGLEFYTGSQFPARYRGGAFVAFHGSWNRAPLPQEGYKVVFVPFDGPRPADGYQVFAEGFRQQGQGPRSAEHRPVDVTEGPDGSLYVTDDQAGWIWRIRHTGQ